MTHPSGGLAPQRTPWPRFLAELVSKVLEQGRCVWRQVLVAWLERRRVMELWSLLPRGLLRRQRGAWWQARDRLRAMDASATSKVAAGV